MEFLRAFMVQVETGTSDPLAEMGKPLRFIASTEGVKRDGLDLRVEDWDLGNYQRNPVVTWAHDIVGHRLPIGRANAAVDLGARQLMADITFDQGDPFAVDVERKYRTGFLHSVSVNWNPVVRGGQKRNELLEIAAVPVPGDPDAVVQRLREWGEAGLLDEFVKTTVGSGLLEEIRAVKAAVLALEVQHETLGSLLRGFVSSSTKDTKSTKEEEIVLNKILEVLK